MTRAIAALLGLTLCACDAWGPPDLAETRAPITITGAGPTGVTASATVVDQIDVHWSAVDTALKYYVLQAANGGAFQPVATTLAPATANADVGLVAGVRYCYEVVAAFPSGAQSEPSAQACAVALGINPVVHAPVTIIIPIQPETNTRGVNLATNGMGNVIAGNVSDPINGFVEYIPLRLDVGTRIDGWRVRVQDSQFSGGSSRIASQLMATTDNQNIPTAIATSSSSSGVGAEETISASVSVVTAPSTQYWISVFDQVGDAAGFVRRLELDIN